MKYALIFAATAAAYDSYGGYGADAESSSAVKASTSAKPIGYTTIVPGYGKQPVTVTTQHQPYPTCVSAGYGGQGCDKWEEDAYVSTVIKDYDNNYATITKTQQPVVVYHTKKTITHSATATSGYAAPTGIAYNKNGTEGCWYELYEKIEEVPYNKLGPHALPGYPGSGLYKEGEMKQPVHVKEYKGGKWSEYDHEYSYGTPEPEVSTYEKPGVYTVPSKDVTIDHPATYPAEATKTAKAGETCTYGGQYIEAKETGYITGAYGAYETKVKGGKTVTETVIKHTTIYASTTGNYEVAKPTTTVYDHDTEVAYPTAKHYEAGVYHHEAQTVTITKPGQAYTCEYEQTKKYEATSTPKHGENYPAHATSTPVYQGSYGHSKPSTTPKKPTEGENKYPSYPAQPAKNNSTSSIHGSYPASTPVAVYSKPSYNGEGGYGGDKKSTMMTVPSKPSTTPAEHYPVEASSTPLEHYPAVSASSTPCSSDLSSATPAVSTGYSTEAYGHATSTPVEHYPESSATPAKSSVYNTDVYGYAVPTPVKPTTLETKPVSYPTSAPVYEDSHYPVGASSTSCESDKPSATPVVPSAYQPEQYMKPSVAHPTPSASYEKPAGYGY
ncbi:hypothetical protein DDE82_002482 [Stemphylium lycopersici]|nr:hypothetical protein DDE82_002482 [Stemphylium lycopersici]